MEGRMFSGALVALGIDEKTLTVNQKAEMKKIIVEIDRNKNERFKLMNQFETNNETVIRTIKEDMSLLDVIRDYIHFNERRCVNEYFFVQHMNYKG